MRWGIRRYQPYPKGYTGSGKEIGEAKRDGSSIRKNDSHNDDRKEIQRKNKETIKKLAIGVGLVAGVGIGAYFAYKYSAIERISQISKNGAFKKVNADSIKRVFEETMHDTDFVFDKGFRFTRMEGRKNVDFSTMSESTYAAYNKKDILKYLIDLPDWHNTNERYQVTLEAVKEMRAPSKKVAVKIFDNFWRSKEGEPFRKELSKNIIKTISDAYDSQFGKGTSKKLKYKAIIQAQAKSILIMDPFKAAIYSIVSKSDNSKLLVEQYKKYGYEFIEDYWDKAGGFVESPVIIFNPSSSVVKVGERFVSEAIRERASDTLTKIKLAEIGIDRPYRYRKSED